MRDNKLNQAFVFSFISSTRKSLSIDFYKIFIQTKTYLDYRGGQRRKFLPNPTVKILSRVFTKNSLARRPVVLISIFLVFLLSTRRRLGRHVSYQITGRKTINSHKKSIHCGFVTFRENVGSSKRASISERPLLSLRDTNNHHHLHHHHHH